jgi:hypothetical protein
MQSRGKVHGGIVFMIRSDIKHEIGKYQKQFLQIISITSITSMVEDWNDSITISAVHSLLACYKKRTLYIHL